MQQFLQSDTLRRIARMDLEGVAIGSVIVASVPAVAPITGGGVPALVATLSVVVVPIVTVLGARHWLRRHAGG